MKNVLVLVNPVSGTGCGTGLQERICRAFRRADPGVRLRTVETGEALFAALPDLTAEVDTIVVAGGDGTVSRVAGRLTGSADTCPPVGVVPLGTGNDLARATGMQALFRRSGLDGVARACVRGHTLKIDTLVLDGTEPCLNYISAGLDAQVAHRFAAIRTRPLVRLLRARGGSKLLYGLLGLRRARTTIAAPLSLHCDTRQGPQHLHFARPLHALIITNISSYAGGMALSSQTRMDDGLFELTVIESLGQLLSLHLGRVLRAPFDRRCPGALHLQACRARICWHHPPALQVDGEARGKPLAAETTIAVGNAVPLIVA